MQLELGMIIEGKVKGIKSFGAFIDLGDGKSGMVHISELSPTYVKEVGDVLSEGQNVKVKIISIADNGKIGLSIKRLAEDHQQYKQNHSQRKKSKSNQYWEGPKKSSEPQNFEDMISKFKQSSEERMSDLKRANESKRGGCSRHSHSR